MASLELGATVAGCRIERVAGRGGMGVVYRATQVRLNRIVALKAIAPELALDAAYRERFRREARLAASIEHPNVIPIYEAGELDDGTLYLVMRWIEGTDLKALLEREGSLPPARAVELLHPVARALDAAHRRGLVHRDVKPANVLIAEPGDGRGEHTYLTDFGVAHGAGEVRVTLTGVLVGTLAYAAPERIRGEPGGPPADIYALGCMLFEALTGKAPFARATEYATIQAHLTEPPPSARDGNADVPDALDDVLVRALAKDPAERYPSAAALGDAMASADSSTSDTATTHTVHHAESIGVTEAARLQQLETRPVERITPRSEAALHETDVGAPVPPDSVPVAAEGPADTTDKSSRTGSRPGRFALVVCLAIVIVLAAGVVIGISRGSGAGHTSAGKTSSRPPALPRLAASPSGFRAGELQSVAPYAGQPWALDYTAPQRVVDLQGAQAPLKVGGGNISLAAGDGALWVSSATSTGGEVRRLTPGHSPAIGTPIHFPAHPTHVRPVVHNGTIWQPVQGGLMELSERGGQPIRVKGLTFTPKSVELLGNTIWATDGSHRLAQIHLPATNAPPEAKIVALPGAGWITGTASDIYVTSRTGVVKVDPNHPSRQTPVGGIASPPTRIAVVGGILWTVTYGAKSSSGRTGTLDGVDLEHPGRKTVPVRFKAPGTGEYITKLVAVNNRFWVTVTGPRGASGLEPFIITPP